MRTFMSIIGLFLVAVALMLLGADLLTTLEHQGQISVRSYEVVWGLMDPGSVKAFHAWMTNTLPGFLTAAVVAVLSIPAWSIGFIGVIIAFIFGRKHETA